MEVLQEKLPITWLILALLKIQIVVPFLLLESRDYKKLDKIAFQNTLRNAKWQPVYNSGDVNEILSRLLHIFNGISNKHVPLKIIKNHKQVK